MKNTRIRSVFVYILTFFLLIGTGYFVYEYTINAAVWALQPINRHLLNGTASSGKILDRDGVILAETSGGKRVYNEKKDIRRAMLHTVGDGSLLIPTSIQSRYKAEIFGYNIITGLGAPRILSTNQDIKITLSSKLCSIASSSFKNMKGTAIVYNYLTGEILCMVSLPTYDPENRPNISEDTQGIYEGAYINRAVSSSFVPGSIFKVMTSAIAVNCIKDIDSRKFMCDKVKLFDGQKVSCMSRHGNINLQDALSKSCDIAFADIAVELGKEKMTSEIEKLGFNRQLTVDKIKLSMSSYDVSEATLAELGWSGVGQYRDTVNPMHMLMIIGAIANSGEYITPYIVSSMSYNSMSPVVMNNGDLKERLFDTGVSDKVKSMMRYTMKNQYGDKMFPGMQICAKTGTGEVGGGGQPHGWMVGFSQERNFPLAFVVIVENGGFGIKSAGPIASAIMKEAYIENINGKT